MHHVNTFVGTENENKVTNDNDNEYTTSLKRLTIYTEHGTSTPSGPFFF